MAIVQDESQSFKIWVLLLTRRALIQGDSNARNQPNAFQMGGDERTEPNLIHFEWGSRGSIDTPLEIYQTGS